MYVGIFQNLNVFARSISSTGERKTLAVDNQYKTQELFREWGVKPVFSDRSDGIPKVIVSPHPDDIPSYGNKCNL